MKLSIIIPTHNKATRLKLCLANLLSICRNIDKQTEIIVIDDYCQDETIDLLTSLQSCSPISMQVVRHDSPQGRAATRHRGAELANGEILLFIDDDILLSQAVLEEHYHAHLKNRQFLLARATILHLPWLIAYDDPSQPTSDIPEKLAKRSIKLQDGVPVLDLIQKYARRTPFETDIHRLLAARKEKGRWLAATGGNISLLKTTYHMVGGFDIGFGLRWGMEDLEFGYRAESQGIRIEHLDTVAVYHMDHPIIQRDGDHQASLAYFAGKHGTTLAERIQAYFDHRLDILEIAQTT